MYVILSKLANTLIKLLTIKPTASLSIRQSFEPGQIRVSRKEVLCDLCDGFLILAVEEAIIEIAT